MCAASGWSRWLTGHIERIVREYDFDGFYLDGSGGGLCWRAEHGPAPHTLFEGHQRTLERLRRRFPDKIMVLHQISHTFNVAQLNISDHLVTFEEFGLSGPPPAAELPVSLRVASSCVSTAIVPGVFCPKDGEPLTPMLWFFSYKKGGEPEPSRRLLKEGIPQFLLNGNIPYTYYFNEKIMWGYNSCPDRLNDKDGIYALYRKLSRDDEFASGDFIPRDVCPYKCETAEVGVAAVVSARGTLLIIANTGGGKTPACEITKDGVKILSLGVMEPFEYRFEIVSGVRRR
jgi:hypothetical protein